MTATTPTVRRLGRDTPHQKYTLSDGTVVVGASTPAKIGHDNSSLMGWAAKQGLSYYRVLKHAGIIGTVAHFKVQCYIEGCEPDLSEFTEIETREADIPYRKFREWWESQDFTVVGTEVQLVSENYRYGGTVDVIARDAEGRLILVDWKSSSGIYQDHICQVSAYRNLVQENMNEDVFRCVIVRGGKQDDEGDFDVKWLDNLDDYFEFFKLQLAIYNAKKLLK